MRFQVEQRFAADADAVARAYADPSLYGWFVDLPKLSEPDVLRHEVDGDVVTLELRYQFIGDLSPAARAVIDPHRLTWVERSTHDLSTRTTRFTMLPDHYRDRFRCQGSYRFEVAGADACRRLAEAELSVKAFLVASAVEGAIVSGLEEHLLDEVPIVERFLGAPGSGSGSD
jgi:hypothetical protein